MKKFLAIAILTLTAGLASAVTLNRAMTIPNTSNFSNPNIFTFHSADTGVKLVVNDSILIYNTATRLPLQNGAFGARRDPKTVTKWPDSIECFWNIKRLSADSAHVTVNLQYQIHDSTYFSSGADLTIKTTSAIYSRNRSVWPFWRGGSYSTSYGLGGLFRVTGKEGFGPAADSLRIYDVSCNAVNN